MPQLDAAYGEALVLANDGAVPQEAEAAFTAALAVDPRNAAGAFLSGPGTRRSARRRAGAIALWQSLLADTPANCAAAPDAGGPHRDADVARSAAGGAPNPRAMVAHAGGAAEGRSQ